MGLLIAKSVLHCESRGSDSHIGNLCEGPVHRVKALRSGHLGQSILSTMLRDGSCGTVQNHRHVVLI